MKIVKDLLVLLIFFSIGDIFFNNIKGRGRALLDKYKERSDRRISGASAHPKYIGMAFIYFFILFIQTRKYTE